MGGGQGCYGFDDEADLIIPVNGLLNYQRVAPSQLVSHQQLTVVVVEGQQEIRDRPELVLQTCFRKPKPRILGEVF